MSYLLTYRSCCQLRNNMASQWCHADCQLASPSICWQDLLDGHRSHMTPDPTSLEGSASLCRGASFATVPRPSPRKQRTNTAVAPQLQAGGAWRGPEVQACQVASVLPNGRCKGDGNVKENQWSTLPTLQQAWAKVIWTMENNHGACPLAFQIVIKSDWKKQRLSSSLCLDWPNFSAITAII